MNVWLLFVLPTHTLAHEVSGRRQIKECAEIDITLKEKGTEFSSVPFELV